MAQSARTAVPGGSTVDVALPGADTYTDTVFVANTGTVDLELGGADLADGNGYPLAAGEKLPATDATKGLRVRNPDATTAGEVAVLVVK